MKSLPAAIAVAALAGAVTIAAHANHPQPAPATPPVSNQVLANTAAATLEAKLPAPLGDPESSSARASYLTVRYPDRAYAEQIGLSLVVTAYRDGVAVRADAYAYWLRPRPAGTLVPAASAVRVVVDRGSRAPIVRRKVTGADAEALRAAVNQLSLTHVLHSCPLVLDSDSDTLRFTTSRGEYVFDLDRTCDPARLHGPGVDVLLRPAGIDATIRRVLHLPRTS